VIHSISTIVLGTAALLLYWFTRRADTARPIDWRGLLARLPLPMLALAASYGVYSFARLFVPDVVAAIQAAAFELTYIGLAVTRTLDRAQRRRATLISVGAVVASIVYNTLAGWFHRQPELLSQGDAISWLMFAILHGAPLAWVAYLVADLLLHSEPRPVSRRPAQLRALIRRLSRGWRTARASTTELAAQLADLREQIAAVAQENAERTRTNTELIQQAANAALVATERERESAALRDQAARLTSTTTEQSSELARLRVQATEQTREIAALRGRPAPLPPSRAQVVAYVRERMHRDATVEELARELGYSASTLRDWLKTITNGHAVEA